MEGRFGYWLFVIGYLGKESVGSKKWGSWRFETAQDLGTRACPFSRLKLGTGNRELGI